MTPGHFEIPRFADIRQGDCGYPSYDRLPDYNMWYARKWDPSSVGSARYVGDKITQLYRNFGVFGAGEWRERSVVIFQIIRNFYDVAQSYETRKRDPGDDWKSGYLDGINEWNSAMERGMDLRTATMPNCSYHVVNYESLFAEDYAAFENCVTRILRAIGLEFNPRIRQGMRNVYVNSLVRAEWRGIEQRRIPLDTVNESISQRALDAYEALKQGALL